MSIVIDKNLCVGCRRCQSVCPGDLIKTDESNKAYIKYPEECWGCTSCLKECSKGAIKYYLGADMGGLGSTMYVKEKDNIMSWIIEDEESNKKVIDINKSNANAY